MNTLGFGVKTRVLDLTFDPHGHSSVDNISEFHKVAPECVQAIRRTLHKQTDKQMLYRGEKRYL